jgi:hypothetical protein
MLGLFFFIGPLVPLRQIYCGIPTKAAPPTPEESEYAFGVAIDIGRQHEEDQYKDLRNELQYFEEESFDETRTIPRGLTHIVQDLFSRWMDRLLPMLSDWSENTRIFSYAAMKSILHCAKEYSVRYVPQILHSCSISLRDFRKEADDSLQVAAIMASSVSATEVITKLVPELGSDGPPHILLLLAATTLNNKPNDGELSAILDALQDAATYEAVNALDSLNQLLLSMIGRSKDFAEVNAVNLLTMIMRISEKKDSVHLYNDAFGRPISEVISDHLQMLLASGAVSPGYLRILLPLASLCGLQLSQDSVCTAVAKVFDRDVRVMANLVADLARRGCLVELPEEFVERIVTVGKEPISMVKTLMETQSLDQSLYEKSDLLISGILESMEQSDDEERLIAVEAMELFERKAVIGIDAFEKAYGALFERLKDHVVAIRVCAARILGRFLLRFVEIRDVVVSKFAEIVVMIDDENEGVRDAIASLCAVLAGVEVWKLELIETLRKQTNYHPEATELCAALLEKLA